MLLDYWIRLVAHYDARFVLLEREVSHETLRNMKLSNRFVQHVSILLKIYTFTIKHGHIIKEEFFS